MVLKKLTRNEQEVDRFDSQDLKNERARRPPLGCHVIAIVSIAPPPSPVFGALNLSGSDLIFSGSNGTANAFYYVLTSTNIALPASNWTRLLTNQFDGNGNFLFTNPASLPQNFYLLQLP